MISTRGKHSTSKRPGTHLERSTPKCPFYTVGINTLHHRSHRLTGTTLQSTQDALVFVAIAAILVLGNAVVLIGRYGSRPVELGEARVCLSRSRGIV